MGSNPNHGISWDRILRHTHPAGLGEGLPASFGKLEGSSHAWFQAYKEARDAAIGNTFPRPVVRAIAQWVLLALEPVVEPKTFKSCSTSKCMLPKKALVADNKWLAWKEDYLQVELGWRVDDKGKRVPVMERAHRLVAWMKGGWDGESRDGQGGRVVAKHHGECLNDGSYRTCDSSRCLNPNHIGVGTDSDNMLEHYESKRRGRKRKDLYRV